VEAASTPVLGPTQTVEQPAEIPPSQPRPIEDELPLPSSPSQVEGDDVPPKPGQAKGSTPPEQPAPENTPDKTVIVEVQDCF